MLSRPALNSDPTSPHCTPCSPIGHSSCMCSICIHPSTLTRRKSRPNHDLHSLNITALFLLLLVYKLSYSLHISFSSSCLLPFPVCLVLFLCSSAGTSVCLSPPTRIRLVRERAPRKGNRVFGSPLGALSLPSWKLLSTSERLIECSPRASRPMSRHLRSSFVR